MENKKKPSELMLFSGHNSFEGSGTLFTLQMLEWPFYNSSREKEITDNVFLDIYRKAIQGLTQISPFKAKISIGVNLESQKLIFTHRTWGEIWLDNERAVCFSHHTKKENEPFYSLYEWPELEDDWEKIPEILYSWTVEQWSDFFRRRILMRAQALKMKAKAKRNDAVLLEEGSDRLLIALIL